MGTVPIVQVWADIAHQVSQAFQVALDGFTEALQAPAPIWPPLDWQRRTNLEAALRSAWSIVPPPGPIRFPLTNT